MTMVTSYKAVTDAIEGKVDVNEDEEVEEDGDTVGRRGK